MLEKIRDAVTNRNAEWGPVANNLDASFRSNELAGECGEVCNEVKKLERARLGVVGGKTGLGDLEEELGDLIIAATLLASHYGIKLEECAKMKFNKTSAKHGFKTIIE